MKNKDLFDDQSVKKKKAPGDQRLNLLVADASLKTHKDKLSKYSEVKSVSLADGEEQLRRFLRKEGEFSQAPSPDVILFDIRPIIRTGLTS